MYGSLTALDGVSLSVPPGSVVGEFIALMREAKAAGQAVFLSSHVISEVQHCADHVAVIRQGHLVRSARVAELRDEAPRSVRLELDAPLTAGQAGALRQAGLAFRPTDDPGTRAAQ